MRILCLLLLLCVLPLSFRAQKKQPTKKTTSLAQTQAVKNVTNTTKPEMKTYYLVFLKKGTKRDQDSVTVAKIQEGHMAHLNKMYAEGKMDIAGPVMSEGDLRGICIYNVESFDEVKKLVESDPAVISGRLIAEIMPWYSQKGAMLR